LCGAHSEKKGKPLSNSELLALVAGNALNENVIHEIESRGLAFRSGDGFLSQLKDAGADTRVLAALAKATITSAAATVDTKKSSELLQHLWSSWKINAL
jgi:hypothetical protein